MYCGAGKRRWGEGSWVTLWLGVELQEHKCHREQQRMAQLEYRRNTYAAFSGGPDYFVVRARAQEAIPVSHQSHSSYPSHKSYLLPHHYLTREGLALASIVKSL